MTDLDLPEYNSESEDEQNLKQSFQKGQTKYCEKYQSLKTDGHPRD